ncbi:MAG: hypothetical protein V4463_17265 [Pseudomonadota bacterium]
MAGCLLPRGTENGRSLHAPRHQREIDLQHAWRGQPYEALLTAFGTPKMSMEIPGRHHDITFAVVNGMNDAASHCIDAFTVVIDRSSRQRLVVDYFCR